MLDALRRLLSFRALIQSLVARDLKARYRGSVLGFFWSFVNPLLLLSVYTFVFTVVLPGSRGGIEPYALFLFCALLPWTWFTSSLLESASVLVAGGNLIRKVLFPAEILPIVTVLAGFVHFCLGLLIVFGAIVVLHIDANAVDLLLWLPLTILVQLVLTLGLALLVAVITVHFRDMRDLLANLMQLWFFATPILYPLTAVPEHLRPLLLLNPFTHLAVAYQEVLFMEGPYERWDRLFILGAGALGVLALGLYTFEKLRDTLPEAV